MPTGAAIRPTRIMRNVASSVLDWIPPESVCPILSGRLRGKKWVIGSSRKACWLGIYENHFQRLLYKHLTPHMIFYDIGANVGFYSLLAAHALQFGEVYSFEPVPRNVEYLLRHVSLNNASNVRVFEMAISDHDGQASFEEAQDHASGHLGAGSLQVKTRSIDSLVAEQQIPLPDCMKIDVEGEELQVLLGAKLCINKAKPRIFLATHSELRDKECRTLLQTFGYTFTVIKVLGEGRADILAMPLANNV